jgi:hypothetical protein
MNELFNEILTLILPLVVGVLLGYYFKKRQIKNEYDRKLINVMANDFLKDLRKYYMPLGYYSSLLSGSSLVLYSELKKGEIKDVSVKHMLFDLGNYIHRILEISEKVGYTIFPDIEQQSKIKLQHLGIVKALNNLLTPDIMTTSILRNISRRCNNNYEEFSKEIDKSEFLKKFKDNLTEDSLIEITKYCIQLSETIEDSIDRALKPWYISSSQKSKKAYKDREQIRKKFEEDVIATLSSEKAMNLKNEAT